MGKKAVSRDLKPIEAMAKVVNLRVSPRKLNLVAQSIRGLKVQRALNELEFSAKRIAGDVRKALYSAISNAENNHSLDIDNLVVAEAYVGKNLTMKRFAARARGRASRVHKPFSEITIVVRELRRGRLMGQKVNPIGLRLGINRTWDSRWYAKKEEYGRLLHQDIEIRRELKRRLMQAGVSRIIIERPHRKCRVTIYAARPGVIIGKKGADIEKLRKDLQAMAEGEVFLNIIEVRKPETDAQLMAENIAQQLERGVAFRRAMKRSMQSAMRLGAKGVRVNVSGRLGGAEIARMEWYREGRVPLHTLRADIDYGFSEAKTTYGQIGVKVWIFKGEVLEHDPMAQDKRLSGETGPASEGSMRERPDRPDRGPRRDRRDQANA